MDRRERRKAETATDFLETWRVTVLLDELLQVVQDFALALGEWLHGARLPKKKRKRKFFLGVRSGVTEAADVRSNPASCSYFRELSHERRSNIGNVRVFSGLVYPGA